jgi:hypothetical protein
MSISKLKSSTIKTGLEKGIKFGGDFLFARNSGTLTTSGLITHLDAVDTLSYPGSGTSWFDLSGNNNNFIFGYAPINNYGYFELDGSTDRASIPYTSSVFRRTDAITYEAFVKIPSNGGFTAGTSVNGGQGTGGINVTATQATSYFTPSNPASDRSVTATYTSIENKWTQICWAVNYSAQTYQWYINGVAVTSTPSGSWTTMTPSGSYAAALDDLIGARHINTRYHTQCDLSIFRVYSRQLNSTEVLNNYNYSKARFGL